MKRWWIKGAKYRTVKKYGLRIRSLRNKRIRGAFQDGITFPWKEWERELNEVRQFKPGEPIFNPYNCELDIVKKVVFEWEPVRRYYFNKGRDGEHGRMVGQYIGGFYIETENGYWIYDSLTTMSRYLPHHLIKLR